MFWYILNIISLTPKNNSIIQVFLYYLYARTHGPERKKNMYLLLYLETQEFGPGIYELIACVMLMSKHFEDEKNLTMNRCFLTRKHIMALNLILSKRNQTQTIT